MNYKIIIVNDGSSDHTDLVIRSYSNTMPIEIIGFEANRGVTEVFRAGFRKVCDEARDDDICVTMDSDNTQNPYVMLDMLKIMESDKKIDIVIASRFEKGGAMVGAPVIRRWLSIGISHILKSLIPIDGVTDYSTFYRACRVKILKDGFAKYGDDLIKGHGFSAMARLLIKLSGLPARIKEVPFILRYDLKEGGSSMNIGRTISGYLNLIMECLGSGDKK